MEVLEQEILLIEDNPGDVLLIKEFLRNSLDINYKLITTDSIKESVNISKTNNPDILLVDLAITDSKGISTFYKVRELFHDKPIIVLSGNNDFELSNITVKEGAQDYLVKGNFTDNTLFRSIQYAIERNKLELAIKEGEEKFRLLADNVPMFIWMLNNEKRLTYVNNRFVNYLGIEKEIILKNNYSEFINYEDRLNRETILQNAYSNKIAYKIEYKLRGQNGGYISVIEKAVPHSNAQNEFCGFIGSCLDITEIKIAEKELEESKIKYKFIAQNSTDVIWSMDTSFNVKYVSPSIKGFLGYSVEDFIMLRAEEYLNKKSLDMVNSLIEESMSNYSLSGDIKDLKTERIELEFITVSGEKKIGEINARLEREQLSEELVIIGITRDITSRKYAEEKKEEYQKGLELLSKSAIAFLQSDECSDIYELIIKNLSFIIPDSLIVVNSIEDRVSRIESFYGLSNYEIVQNLLNEKLKGFRITLPDEPYNQLLKGELIELHDGISELVFNNLPKSVILALESLFKINKVYIVGLSSGEKLFASVIIFIKKGCCDINSEIIETFIRQATMAVERKYYLSNLKESEKLLKELNASKDKVFSIISHDLRSPYQGILGYLDLLVKDYEILDKDALKPILQNLHKLMNGQYDLLERMLLWANMQRGKIPYVPKLVNLKSVLEKVSSRMRLNAVNKDILLTVKQVDDVNFLADSDMLESILSNVLSNAVKFTNRGGEIIVSSKVNDTEFEISIKDNGVGIDKEHLANLFVVDKQNSELGTEHERGSGLGLVLCKEFVELHKGRIKVISEKGNGTEFIIVFPK